MYIESNIHDQRPGSIEVICGSMFSGKTEELIRRVKRAQIARQNIIIFKPTIDIRYSREDVVSHNRTAIQAIPVEHSRLILRMGKDAEVIAIDEAQFFDDGIVDVCNALANMGKRVIVAGLDMDYLGKPFGPMPNLLSIADEVTKTRAICMRCGRLASFSYRIAENDQQVLLGEKSEYMPLCRTCYQELTEMQKNRKQ
ncbi:MAG: thymidine kinase [Bacteroidales bacterium]|nr:thymidine kinase [Bacteroidales bacterium]MBO7379892.1 thymidine kinase [Bacteroidales bacterium]MBP5764374.1 thymidine kinase [Bacteroidales bacterium]